MTEPCELWTRHRVEVATGQATETDAAIFERHTSDCPTCSQSLLQMRETLDALAAMPHAEPPESVVDAIFSFAHTQIANESWWRRVHRRIAIPRPLFAPAMGVAILVLAFLTFGSWPVMPTETTDVGADPFTDDQTLMTVETITSTAWLFGNGVTEDDPAAAFLDAEISRLGTRIRALSEEMDAL